MKDPIRYCSILGVKDEENSPLNFPLSSREAILWVPISANVLAFPAAVWCKMDSGDAPALGAAGGGSL